MSSCDSCGRSSRGLRLWWWAALTLATLSPHDAVAASRGLRRLPSNPLFAPAVQPTTSADANTDANTDANANANANANGPSSSAGSAAPQEITLQWHAGEDGSAFEMQPLAPLTGDDAIVVFFDRAVSKDESAVVTFDIKTQPNCVVSICGTKSWLLFSSSENCYAFQIAPKSNHEDDQEDGLITGLSAAFARDRPIAKKLYLKFDDTNYIDKKPCQYKVIRGEKILRSTSAIQTQATS